MIDLQQFLSGPGQVVLAGAPEGVDALALATLARQASHPALFVARDEGRMAAVAEALGFFAPEIEVLTLPPWDCVPYDRISPNAEVASRRLLTLSLLGEAREAGQGGRRIVLTTVSAFLQKLPPPSLFRDSAWSAAVGARVDVEALSAFLARNGYVRADTVMEPGEYALRGGIIDVFPPGTDEPLRLDLFGDELEAVRTFDPMSQRSVDKREGVRLMPVSEVTLDDAAIARFRTGYRELFGNPGNDPLYESISAGRKHLGMEHWLPLFHDHLVTLLDYLPEGAPVLLDHQAEEARDARIDMVTEHYRARLDFDDGRKATGEAFYRPVPPERLFMDAGTWRTLLQDRPVALFSPFAREGAEVVALGGRAGRDFADLRAKPDINIFEALREHIAAELQAGRRVVVATFTEGSRDRLLMVLREHKIGPLQAAASFSEIQTLAPKTVAVAVLGLEHGFVTDDLSVIGEQDILGQRLARPARRRKAADKFIADASALSEGDLVVHTDHGIGRYDGLETLSVLGAAHDCLRLIYEGGDKLYVPVENIDVLSRFGSETMGVQLDRLGGAAWQARKARLKQRIRDMAEQLIRVAAERQLRQAEALAPPEGLYDEFAARFPYAETDDQQRAIADVIEDLGSGRPMDRLVCGDVGFGKTEVALRAAFLAVMSGRQVAVAVPTTLLARQHFRTFQQRFAGLPVRVGQLSRLVTGKAASAVKTELAAGQLDVVVGTHALLGKGIHFKDLGLLIVDEEQHFGVAHKERLKQMRSDVHVLTLTATPIPRTLQMALTGVRELSLIATPPVDRLAVRTFVMPFDPVVIREAILREKFRQGQTFYVCPRLEDLPKVAEELRKLVPEIRVAQAHGRLAASDLEDVMTGFYEGQYDVLLSTNIVESGLDIPTANTMIIHRADMFGLAQLYQLRGRIGRAKQRGYCYLTLPGDRVLSAAAQKRLHVMQSLDTLGAGFQLASHDLDIRGAGNLLGDEQSGHIREVGIELYQQLLEEAVAAARSEKSEAEVREAFTPQISIGTSVLIPESYVTDLSVRLSLYRRIATLADRAEIEAFAAEMIDRFGSPLPPEVENLLEIVAIKRLCLEANVEKLEAGPKGAVIALRNNLFPNPEGLVAFLGRQAGTAKVRPDHKIVYMRNWETPKDRLKGVQQLMKTLAEIASRSKAA